MKKSTFVEKNLKLGLEFDRYVVCNADVLAKIPRGAHVVITVKGDNAFNRSSMQIVKKVSGIHSRIIEARKEGRKWVIRSLVPASA